MLKNLSKVFGVGLIGLGITPLFSGVALANEDNLESIQAFQQQSAAIAKKRQNLQLKTFQDQGFSGDMGKITNVSDMNSSSMNQVTSVNELRDVQPTEWA